MNALRNAGFLPIGVFGGKCEGSMADAAASAIMATALMPSKMLLGAAGIFDVVATAVDGVLNDTSTVLPILHLDTVCSRAANDS